MLLRRSLVALLLLTGSAAAQDPIDTAELLRLETTLFEALNDRNRTALDRLLAPDYVLRGSPDIDRDEWLTNAVTLCWGRATIERFQVRSGMSTAIASFEITFDRHPTTCQPATMRSLITDVWQLRDGTWQLAVRHSGPPGSGDIAAQFGIVPESPPVLEARGELSFVSTGGNASTRTLGLSGDVGHRGRRTTTTAGIAFVRSEAESVENARSLTLQGRQGWRVTARTEGFARGEYLRDVFAGVEHRGTAEGGISYAPRERPHAIRLDVGLGGTSETRLGAEDRQFVSATGGAIYRWTPSPLSELLVQSSVTSDLQRAANWRSANQVSVLVSVTRLMSARIAYSLRYLNEPVPGFRRTDTSASAALVLSYARRAPAP